MFHKKLNKFQAGRTSLPTHVGAFGIFFDGGGEGGDPTHPQTEKKLPKTIIFLSKKKLDLGQPLPLVETKSQLFPKHFGVCHMAPLLVEIVLNLVWLKAVYNGGGFWKKRDGERNPGSYCPIW